MRLTRRSNAEMTVETWLVNEGYEVFTNVRNIIELPSHKMGEIDIYIPSIQFGVEVDGEHWHREEPGLTYSMWELKKRYGCLEPGTLWEGYHKLKDDQCAKKGIHLYHIVSEDVRDFTEQTRRKLLEEIEDWKERRLYGV